VLIVGSITAVWTFLWLAVVHDSPESHPRISEQEKEYLMKSIALNTSKDKVIIWFLLGVMQWVVFSFSYKPPFSKMPKT